LSYQFIGIVTQIGSNYCIVKGRLNDDQPLGYFDFGTSDLPELTIDGEPYGLQIDAKLRLTHNGKIRERSPAQIWVTDWQVI